MEKITEQEKKSYAIDEMIQLSAESEDIGCLLDGIVNQKEYDTNKIRILWILKEPYDDFDDEGNPVSDGYDYRKALNEKLHDYKRIKTWQRIAYASHGILNDIEYYDMDNITDDETPGQLFEVIRKIAFINIKKSAGGKTSASKSISEAYVKNKSLLMDQIEFINPTIIIGGGTIPHFLDDFQLHSSKHEGNNLKYYIRDDRLYIDAYHPSYPKGDAAEEEYVNDLVRVSREFLKRQNPINWNAK